MGRIYDPRSRSLGQLYHGGGDVFAGGAIIKKPKAAISRANLGLVTASNPINRTTYGANVINPPYGHGAHVNTKFCMEQLGLTEIRMGLQWLNIQIGGPGTYDWSEPDDVLFDVFANSGISFVVPLETTGPTWASGFGNPWGGFPTGGTVAYYNWVDLYADFIYKLALRYKGLVRMYEVGNECNTSGHFFIEGNNTGAPVRVQWYAYWYNKMRAAIKAADPDAGVGLSSVYAISYWPATNGISGYNWYDQCLNTYHLETDAVSIHPYSIFAQSDDPKLNNYPNNSFGNDIARIQSLMRSSGIADKELMVSEWGWYQHDDVTNAQYVTDSFNIIKDNYSIEVLGQNNAGVTSAHYYHLFNDRINDIDSNNSGLFRWSPIIGPSQIQLTGLAVQNFMNTVREGAAQHVTPGSPSVSLTAIRMIQTGVNLVVNPDAAVSTSTPKTGVANHTLNDAFGGTTALNAAWVNVRGTASAVAGNYQASVAPSEYYRGDYTPPVNQRYILTLNTVSTQCFGLLRYDPVTDSGYKFAAEPGQAVFYKVTNGVDTPLITVTGITWAVNDTVSATISGTTLTLLRNGASIGTKQDGTYLVANYIGVGTGDTTDKIAAVFVTELPSASGTLLQPLAAVSSSIAKDPATVFSGNQVVTLGVAISVSALVDAVLNRAITAPVAVSSSTANNLTINASSAQFVTPTPAISTSTPNSPLFNIAVKAPVAVAYAMNASSGLRLNRSIVPPVATSASTAIGPSITTGSAQSVTPGHATTSSIALDPTIGAAQSVTPSVAISTSTTPTPVTPRSIVAPVATSTSTAITPSVINGSGVSDDFAGTGALGAWTSLVGTASRVSGDFVASSAPAVYYRNDFSPGSNQTVDITVGALPNDADAYLRFDTTLFNGYLFAIHDTDVTVSLVVAGVPSGLFVISGLTIVSGDIIRCKIAGTTIQVFQNGSQVGTNQTDATYSAGGRICIGVNSTGDIIQNFAATSP